MKNKETYGTAEPPEVPLGDISIPTALFIGSTDNLATVEDNEWLTTKLNPDVLVHKKVYPLGHLGFADA